MIIYDTGKHAAYTDNMGKVEESSFNKVVPDV